MARLDGVKELAANLAGSLQNPAFSPDSKSVLFTRFRHGYNQGPADLFIFHLATGNLRKLVSDGSANINLPGSSWNARTASIVFSSDRGEHDEIFAISANGRPGDEVQLTNQTALQVYEPSFSSDGSLMVFEAHKIDKEAGVIATTHLSDPSKYTNLTKLSTRIKQPNWSPKGDFILYQKNQGTGWGIWLMDDNGGNKHRLTPKDIEATDAVFTPDGTQIVFSGEKGTLSIANIFSCQIRACNSKQITRYNGYDGAPSVSPDGRFIAFESSPWDPDNSPGTKLWIINSGW